MPIPAIYKMENACGLRYIAYTSAMLYNEKADTVRGLLEIEQQHAVGNRYGGILIATNVDQDRVLRPAFLEAGYRPILEGMYNPNSGNFMILYIKIRDVSKEHSPDLKVRYTDSKNYLRWLAGKGR